MGELKVESLRMLNGGEYLTSLSTNITSTLTDNLSTAFAAFPSTSSFIATSTTIIATVINNETLDADAVSSYKDDDYLNALSDDDYIDFVANFLKPTFIEMIFVVIFLCLMIVGITGNCLVVYVVTRNKSMVYYLIYY